MSFVKGLVWMFKGLFNLLVKIKSFIPAGIISIFVFFNFFVNLKEFGFSGAFGIAARSLLAAETTIRTNVDLAITNSPTYGFSSLFAIVISFYILYRFIKIIGFLLIKLTGSQAEYMAYFVGLLITGLIEFVAVVAIDGTFTFIPIYHGLIYLFINLGPVLNNLHFFGWQVFKDVVNTNQTLVDAPNITGIIDSSVI